MRAKLILKAFIVLVFLTFPVDFAKTQTGSADVVERFMQLRGSEVAEEEMDLVERGEDRGLDTKITLDLRSMDIVDTIRFLARQANVNIVTTDRVSGRITFFLEDVSVGDVLDMIIITNNLARKEKNNIITIMTEDEYQQLYGQRYTSMKESEMLTLNYIDTERAKSMLDNIKSNIGKVIVDDSTGTILLIDTARKIEEMKKAVARIDIPSIERIIPTVTEEFELSYARAGEIRGEIEEALTEQAGSVRIDERTNKLVVTDLEHNMEKIRQLVRAFDAKTRGVTIEAKIMEVTLSDDYAFGIEWEKIFDRIGSLKDITLTGAFPSPMPLEFPSSMQVEVGTLESDKYTAALEFVQSIGNIRILSSPRMTVLHNEEAKFMVGTREAYVTRTVTHGETIESVAEDVEFIDVGVTLFVTPTINKEGFVTMDIRPEVSSIRDKLVTGDGTVIPIVETTNLETVVSVKDGHTIVLAGFIKKTEAKSKAQTPFFGNLPLIGAAFRNIEDVYEKKELVIFLTPRIVTGQEDHSYLDRDQRKPRKPPR